MEHIRDVLYTIDDWYDGARDGAASFRGTPVRYRSVFRDTETWDADEDRFELTSISEALLTAMIEVDLLWQRWDDARKAGALPQNAPGELPPLPEDRERYAALTTRIDADLAALRPTVLARGTFDYARQRVEWTPIAYAELQL
ncbi:MAG TPA: hypothetical protein VFH27_04380 [Longimicrobiaceae bacterium]|nr:hypothetical protein [Longimicrobiaceae bacterium]